MFMTSGAYPWIFVTQIFHNGRPSHGGDRKTFEVMTSTQLRGTLGSVASLLAATLYQGNPRNHKFWNIVSTERYVLHIQVLLHINLKFTMGKLKSSLCRKVSYLTPPLHCECRGASLGMQQSYLYLWYPFFQAQWHRCINKIAKLSIIQ